MLRWFNTTKCKIKFLWKDTSLISAPVFISVISWPLQKSITMFPIVGVSLGHVLFTHNTPFLYTNVVFSRLTRYTSILSDLEFCWKYKIKFFCLTQWTTKTHYYLHVIQRLFRYTLNRVLLSQSNNDSKLYNFNG